MQKKKNVVPGGVEGDGRRVGGEQPWAECGLLPEEETSGLWW